jgi:hypothetical protein
LSRYLGASTSFTFTFTFTQIILLQRITISRLRTGTLAGFCEQGNEISVSTECEDFGGGGGLGQWLLASQKSLYYMHIYSFFIFYQTLKVLNNRAANLL